MIILLRMVLIISINWKRLLRVYWKDWSIFMKRVICIEMLSRRILWLGKGCFRKGKLRKEELIFRLLLLILDLPKNKPIPSGICISVGRLDMSRLRYLKLMPQIIKSRILLILCNQFLSKDIQNHVIFSR